LKKIFLFLLISVLLCGCSNTDDPPATEYIVSNVSSEGNLNIYCYSAESYNPLFASNNANIYLSRICFEPLIRTTDDQSAETVLAQGYFISEDGLTWTVPLRNDIYWHDGDAFSAKDVVATCNTIIKNIDKTVYSYNMSNVERVEAEDEYTVKFYLKTPQTCFANLLEIPVVKAEHCELQSDFPMIGTGVFKYVGTENKKMYFEANENWWGKVTPDIKHVTAVMLPDKETAGFAFNSKVIDVIPASIKDWSQYPSADDKSIEYSTGDFFYLKFNTSNEQLANYEIRNAIAQAIDKQAIRDKALLSHGVVTDTVLNPDWKFYSKNAKKTGFNPDNARAVMSNYTAEGRMWLDLIINEGSEIKRNTAVQIKEALYPLGIDVNILVYGWNDYINVYNSGEYDIALCETNIGPDMLPYKAIGNNEPIASAILQLQNCGIDEERMTHFHIIQELVNTELDIVPLFYDTGVLLYNDKIKEGLAPTRTNIYNNIHLWRLNT